MPTSTPNLKLQKPLQTEFYDIDAFLNPNLDLIDSFAGTTQKRLWKPNEAVQEGYIRYPNNVPACDTLLLCIASGVTSNTEPLWGNIGGTQTDGSAQWKIAGILTAIEQATEDTAGIVEIASLTETQEGTDHTRVVTPYTLNEFNKLQGKAAFNIRLTSNQAIGAANTKLLFDNVQYDETNLYSASQARFQPDFPCRMMVFASAAGSNSAGYASSIGIYKNGTDSIASASYSGSAPSMTCVILIDFNGTTDYVEIFASASSGSTFTVVADVRTAFRGVIV